jgi:hypothetical protein
MSQRAEHEAKQVPRCSRRYSGGVATVGPPGALPNPEPSRRGVPL